MKTAKTKLKTFSVFLVTKIILVLKHREMLSFHANSQFCRYLICASCLSVRSQNCDVSLHGLLMVFLIIAIYFLTLISGSTEGPFSKTELSGSTYPIYKIKITRHFSCEKRMRFWWMLHKNHVFLQASLLLFHINTSQRFGLNYGIHSNKTGKNMFTFQIITFTKLYYDLPSGKRQFF